jgi:hypothetical protein
LWSLKLRWLTEVNNIVKISNFLLNGQSLSCFFAKRSAEASLRQQRESLASLRQQDKAAGGGQQRQNWQGQEQEGEGEGRRGGRKKGGRLQKKFVNSCKGGEESLILWNNRRLCPADAY